MIGRAITSLALLAVLLAAAPACDGDSSHQPETFLSLHAELAATGKVLYAEIELPREGDQVPSTRIWYWPEKSVSRRAYFAYPGQHTSTGIITATRDVDFDLRDNHLSDDPIDAPPGLIIPTAAGPLWAYFESRPAGAGGSMRGEETNHGETDLDGRRVLHLSYSAEALEEGHERPKGTEYRFDVYFDADSHLPVRSEWLVTYPGQPPSGPAVFSYLRAELVDAATLPSGHFDPDALASLETTLDEAVEVAANTDFAVFWLGKEFPAEWTSHQGNRFTSATLLEVEPPGVSPASASDSAVVAYGMPPDFRSPMLRLLQQPVGSAREPRDLAAMLAAGNVHALAGFDGYVYAQYSARGACSFAQAQTDAACRMFPDPVWGAVLVIDGTQITIATERLADGDGGVNKGAFPTRESIERLVPMLRPIGE